METKMRVAGTTKNPASATDKPKCRVIRRKDPGKPGVRCTRNAAYIINITNPDDKTTILASLLICEKCSDRFESGKSLVVESKSGEHLLVQAS